MNYMERGEAEDPQPTLEHEMPCSSSYFPFPPFPSFPKVNSKWGTPCLILPLSRAVTCPEQASLPPLGGAVHLRPSLIPRVLLFIFVLLFPVQQSWPKNKLSETKYRRGRWGSGQDIFVGQAAKILPSWNVLLLRYPWSIQRQRHNAMRILCFFHGWELKGNQQLSVRKAEDSLVKGACGQLHSQRPSERRFHELRWMWSTSQKQRLNCLMDFSVVILVGSPFRTVRGALLDWTKESPSHPAFDNHTVAKPLLPGSHTRKA